MKKYDEFVAEKNYNKYKSNKYDDEVKSAVYDYVSGLTSSVNGDLRKGKEVPSITNVLDKAFTERKKLDVYRTVDWSYMENVYGITGENIKDKIGSEITNKGYMSTASIMESPWGSKWSENELIVHIVSDKEYPCVDINKMFDADEIDCEEQMEILVPRNTTIRLVDAEKKFGGKFCENGNWFIEAKIV